MEQDDPRREEIIIMMKELAAKSRLLKDKNDELIAEYLKLKQELKERTTTEKASRFGM